MLGAVGALVFLQAVLLSWTGMNAITQYGAASAGSAEVRAIGQVVSGFVRGGVVWLFSSIWIGINRI